jgi:hypothetical protein
VLPGLIFAKVINYGRTRNNPKNTKVRNDNSKSYPAATVVIAVFFAITTIFGFLINQKSA